MELGRKLKIKTLFQIGLFINNIYVINIKKENITGTALKRAKDNNPPVNPVTIRNFNL